MQRRAFLALAAGALPLEAQGAFTQQLWFSIANIYKKTLEHPFLRGLTDGTLPQDRFRFYLIQDTLYLRVFAQALAVLSSKSPDEGWAAALAQDGLDTSKETSKLHDKVLARYGVAPGEARRATMAPTTRAYTNHLLASVHRLSFGEGLAALLPCYWIYWEVGKELKKKGSKEPVYQSWIDQYSDPAYGKIVERVLGIMNRAPLSEYERVNARELFLLSARYEYLFWDMAWRTESWPQ